MFADGGFTDDGDDALDGSSDPYAYDSEDFSSSSSPVAIDSGAASPTSSGNVRSADPLPGSTVPLRYFGDPASAPRDAISRAVDYESNPSAYGANPKSNFWRRLGGALIDTAGTWGAGFGVPRGITHHLANDVRYGADAAHQQEDYYQNLPMIRDAAAMEERRQQLAQQQKNQDLQRQYQLLQIQNQKDFHDDSVANRQMTTRQMAETKAAGEGYQPLPQALPSLNTTESLPGTDISLPLNTGGMSPEQQIPKGWTPRNLPAAPGLPAERGMVPPPHNDWPVISPEMADQLNSLGVKGVQSGVKVDPRVYDAYQATIRQQVKEPPITKEIEQRTVIADQLKLTGRDRTAYIATGKFAEYPPSYTVKVGAEDDKRALRKATNDAFRAAGGDWNRVMEMARAGLVNPDFASDIFDQAEKMSKLPADAQRRVASADATSDQVNVAVQAIREFVASHPDLVGSGIKDPVTGIKRWAETKLGIEPADIGAVDAALESAAALQPGQHNFRSIQALSEFKKALGIDPRTGKADGSRAWLVNPEKAIGALQGVSNFNQSLKQNIQRAGHQIPTGSPLTSPTTNTSAPPAVGTIQDGYRFKGGNPADQKNWEPVTNASQAPTR